MQITNYLKGAERFKSNVTIETEGYNPRPRSGAGLAGDKGTVTIPLTNLEGYKGRMYQMRLTEEEAIALRDVLNEKLANIEQMRREAK